MSHRMVRLQLDLERETMIQGMAIGRDMRAQSEERARVTAQELLNEQQELATGDDLTTGLRLYDVALECLALLVAPRKLPAIPLTGRYIVATALIRALKDAG